MPSNPLVHFLLKGLNWTHTHIIILDIHKTLVFLGKAQYDEHRCEENLAPFTTTVRTYNFLSSLITPLRSMLAALTKSPRWNDPHITMSLPSFLGI